MFRAFEQGIYWPRWFQTVYNGLGAPTFHHYSPGLYWLVAAGQWTGSRLDQAVKIVVTAALILSGFGVYAWLRYTFSPEASLAGATLYLFHPHILTRAFYFVGDYPQLLAFLLLPACLWAFTALHTQSRARYWLAAVITLAALILSHNLMAMVGAGILTLYWLLLAAGYRKPHGLLRCAVAALLAALLSAGFWLPALADLSLVQIDNARQGFFHYSNHFLSWSDLISVQSFVIDSRAGNALKPPITFGAASWLAVAAGLSSSLFVICKERRIWGVAGALFALAVLTLSLPVSEPLWRTVPALDFVQFPSRFLAIAPLGALPAAALAIDAWQPGRRWLPALTLVMTFILFLFPYLFPAYTSFSPFLPMKTLTAEDTRLYEQLGDAWGMTGSNEFLIRGANWDIITGQTAEPSATRLTWRSPHEGIADLSEQTEPMLLRLHFHPGWSAGERATLTQGPAGWTQVTELRQPAQPLMIRWEGTAWQRWGERLSLVGLLASIAGLLFLNHRRKGRGERTASSSLTSPLGAMVACVFVLVVARYTLDRSGGAPFVRHSPPGQLAFAVEGQPITLGDATTYQVTLLGWELLSSATPKPGDTVIVRLYWQPHGRIDEQLNGFLHLYTPSLKRSWVVKNRGSGRPDSQWWNPDKYYVDELRLTIPLDTPPVTYSLVAGLVSSDGARLAVPGSTDGVVHLRSLEVAPTRPGLLQRERPIIRARADTADGLRLQGYDLQTANSHESQAHSGSILRLFWETTAQGPATDWITYVHLHDPQGERIAQFDGPALAGLQPTSHWQTDALYIDQRQISLPTDLPPGTYLFRIGLYNFSSGERLPFRPDPDDQAHFENSQLLVPLTIPEESAEE